MKLLTITLLTALSFSAMSQNTMPDRVVYAAAGKMAKPALGNTFINDKIVDYTIGEPLIFSGQVGTNIIHNGFQQPYKILAIGPSVVMLQEPNVVFKVYPNPASTYSIIEGPEDQKEVIQIQLLDVNAKLIGEYRMETNRLWIDFENKLTPGTYFLNFYDLSGQFIQQNKLIKQ
jgi:hypothetical protein